MGYMALAILLGVVAWTLWRMVNHRRLPLNYFSTFDDAVDGKKDENKTESLNESKHEIENEETTPKTCSYEGKVKE